MRILGLILISLLMDCVQTVPKYSANQRNIKQPGKAIDTSIYAILKFDTADNYYFDKSVKASTISYAEIVKVETLIDNVIAEYNKNAEKNYKKNVQELKKKFPGATADDERIPNPAKYFKQLIVVVNAKGEKIVWANCFCSLDNKSYWKKGVVLVSDGGSCYFNLKINLTKGTVYDLMINGEA